jgi:drug/metabolite transporter (DMT)-like permease
MNWFAGALISTLLFSLVTILDKRLVGSFFPSYHTFSIAFGLLQFPIAAVFFAFVIPTVGFESGEGVLWALASGLLWAVGLSLFFYGLSIEEVSRAAPMQSVTPVITAVIAVVLFGDIVSPTQWAGILVVVGGAVMINLRKVDGRYRIARGRAFVVLLLAAFALGSAFIVSDEATDRLNVGATQGLRALGMGVGVLALSARPRHISPLIVVLQNRRTVGLMLVAEGIMAPTAALIFVYALSVGSVSLVTTVAAVRPLAILVLSLSLSTRYWNVLHEPMDRDTIGLKVVATLLIVGGVVTLRF